MREIREAIAKRIEGEASIMDLRFCRQVTKDILNKESLSDLCACYQSAHNEEDASFFLSQIKLLMKESKG